MLHQMGNFNIKQISFALHEPSRQLFLIEPASLVIALPGALGTFSEILAAIMKNKPVVLCNMWIEERQSYYYDSFYNLLKTYHLANNVYIVKIDQNMPYEDIKLALNEVISTQTKRYQSELTSNSIFALKCAPTNKIESNEAGPLFKEANEIKSKFN